MYLKNKRVMITGACGTVGKTIVHQLLQEHNIKELVALDNNESELFALENKYLPRTEASFFLADVRDSNKLSRKMNGMDVIFHTAAFKHVTLCERSPFEAVQTNIIGVQNIIQAAIKNSVKKVIFTSSDKAVNPTNVMGTSKLMGERLMTAANSNLKKDGPVFASTRFGNVLGSRGSVLSVFSEQIQRGGPVTLTDPDMTRFIMSIKDAAQLVIESASLAKGGEVFITKMPAIRIQDLAEVMIQELAPLFNKNPKDIQINIIGAKQGEKMYEELLNLEETRRAYELKNYFVIMPPFIRPDLKKDNLYSEIVSNTVTNPYHSRDESPLSKNQLAEFLRDNDLFNFNSFERKFT